MLKRVIYAGLMAGVAGLYSCSQNQGGSGYADTKAFFEKRMELDSIHQTGIEKELVFGDKHEHTRSDTVNWKEELKSFAEIDLLKPSYNGRYTIDTLERNHEGYTVIYKCTDLKTGLQEVTISYTNDHISMLRALYTESNSLYRSGKILTYYTDSCYSITGNQTVKMGNAVCYSINGKFIRP
jgi:hypothetical protein